MSDYGFQRSREFQDEVSLKETLGLIALDFSDVFMPDGYDLAWELDNLLVGRLRIFTRPRAFSIGFDRGREPRKLFVLPGNLSDDAMAQLRQTIEDETGLETVLGPIW